MGLEENKELIRQYMHAVWGAGDLTVADQLLADDYIDHNAPPGIASDRTGHRRSVAAFHNAFPDAEFFLEDLIAEGDQVVVRWRMQARHLGPFLGLPVSGKVCQLDGID